MQDKQGSPGWLDSAIILLRLGLLDGIAVRDNRIWASSLRTDEFRFRDGWSFFLSANKADAERKTKEHSAWKSEQAGRVKIYGYALVSVGDIRSVTDSAGRPAFVVVASPSKNNPDHISVRRARDYDEEETAKIRRKLVGLLSDVVIPE